MSADTALVLYTVTHRPTDLPGAVYAVRAFYVRAGTAQPGPLLGSANTLDGVRQLIPSEAGYRLPRSPLDDPVIVETWV